MRVRRLASAFVALWLVAAACSTDGTGTLRIYTSVTQATVDSVVEGVVERIRFEGPVTEYLVSTAAGAVQVRREGPSRLDVGDPAHFGLDRAWVLGAE